jgi:hypothetical protein
MVLDASVVNDVADSWNCRHITMMRSPPARRTHSSCYRSASHCLFCLFVILSHERGWSNGFEWDSNFVWCLMLLSWMTSQTVGTVDILPWWGPLQRGELIRRVTGQLATVFSVFMWHYLMRGVGVMGLSGILTLYGAWCFCREWRRRQLEL